MIQHYFYVIEDSLQLQRTGSHGSNSILKMDYRLMLKK